MDCTVEKVSNTHWYQKTVNDVFKALDSSKEGLTEKHVVLLRAKYGRNSIAQASPPSLAFRFALQFKSLLVLVLVVAVILTASLQHWLDASVIFAVILINALIGVVQEGKAEKAIASIRHLLAVKASVIRGGIRTTIDGEEVVPGDIVILAPGDKVPADLRLIKAESLQIQESILTGEAQAVMKKTDALDAKVAMGDRSCMAFSGTTVVGGQGIGVVVDTGAHTEIGKIGGLLSKVEKLTTPLTLKMNVLAKWVTALIIGVGAILLFVGIFLLQRPFLDVFMAVIGLSVAAIPEGLPAVLTITLAVGVQAMARRNAIIRVLPAIETLGAVSVICSDKTGTLTRNEMQVTKIHTAYAAFDVSGEGYQPEGEIRNKGVPITLQHRQALTTLALACNLCNDAELYESEGQWLHHGDPMEAALLSFSHKVLGTTHFNVRDSWPRKCVMPFNANSQYMATLNANSQGEFELFVKGAPEKVIAFCRSQKEEGADVSIERSFWLQEANEMAASGLRVLALAVLDQTCKNSRLEQSTQLTNKEIDGHLCLLGLVGLMDPPRSGVSAAIEECHRAQIHVKMITGDHAVTAQSIGKQLGLARADTVLTGEQIDALSDNDLKVSVQNTDIFARTTPEHKLRLVMALQALDLVVVMTGDGVNDAPSLKRADAGVAMGLKGCEAAKDAAEIVLADDNFTSIVAAIEQGRTVYSNIKKVVSWTLPTNAGEALTIIVALIAGMPYPITPVQILWVNMITAISLGIALAFEPPDKNIMAQPPRPRNQSLIQGDLLWHILMVGVLFFIAVFGVYHFAMSQNVSVALARTQSMNMLVGLEVFYLLFIRRMHLRAFKIKGTKTSKAVWIAIVLVITAQAMICHFPFLQDVFGTASPAFIDYVTIFIAGALLWVFLETEKLVRQYL
ncbi:carbonate dehydratase [Alteromonas sp. KUL106]|nr:carbonate dehydratase [Alteromonas sp. KUL106]